MSIIPKKTKISSTKVGNDVNYNTVAGLWDWLENSRKSENERPPQVNKEKVNKMCSQVITGRATSKLCPVIRPEPDGSVSNNQWMEILSFYDAKMDIYKITEPTPLSKIINLERWLFEIIPPIPVDNIDYEKWRQRELEKIENFYTFCCPDIYREEVAEKLREIFPPQIITYMREKILSMSPPDIFILPDISEDQNKNRQNGVVNIKR